MASIEAKVKGEYEDSDRLSSLPHSLLIHILSFLPTLYAVRTMLIKRFGNLWTYLPDLELDNTFFDIWHDDESSTSDLPFFIYARNLLMRHRSPKIGTFKVNLVDMYYSDIEQRKLSHELDSWINFALRKQAKVLHFNVSMVEPEETPYVFPHAEFVSDSLVELKLEFLEMKVQRVQMGLLRVLRLIRVILKDNEFREIIKGCPLLEELEVYNCWDLDDLSFASPSVEKLTLDTTEDFNHVIKIDCPKLKSFDFTGFVDYVDVVNFSSLIEGRFNLSCRNLEFKEFPQFVAFLKRIISAEVVSLSCEFATVLFHCMSKDLPNILINWKRIELSIWLTERHIVGLQSLMRYSSSLEQLVINVTSWHSDFIEPIESEIDDPMFVGKDCSSCVKCVIIHNIVNSSYAVLVHLVQMLLENAIVLEKLVIYYGGKEKSSDKGRLTSEELAEFHAKLSTFPKASQHSKIQLL